MGSEVVQLQSWHTLRYIYNDICELILSAWLVWGIVASLAIVLGVISMVNFLGHP